MMQEHLREVDESRWFGMGMTMMFETMESMATICGGMPTTMRPSDYRNDAPIGDRAASDLTDTTTTTRSNIYSYINGNPMNQYDYLCLRPIALEPPQWNNHHVRSGHI